jgi:nitrate reductase delta subunit
VKTFKVLSLLLSYPQPELAAYGEELVLAFEEERFLPAEHCRALADFVKQLSRLDPLDAEERYVALFDRGRALSLYLYEHIHGESRDRGEAMARLARLYRLHGLEISARELPDYLPLFLEFLSLLPQRAARSLLAEAAPVIAALAKRLEACGSPYAAAMRAVEALAARPPEGAATDEIMAALAPDCDSAEALDREWREEAVRFAASGAPNAPGCTAGSRG